MRRLFCRALCLALAAVLLAGCSAAPADRSAVTAAPADKPEVSEPEAEAAQPKVGDSQSGFTVTQLVPMDTLGATGILYEHEKSGAKLLYLQCEDSNRSFDISFRTPALDDKGKPHVFEHITICGSQKYPDANLFFPFTSQTYNSYANAFTYHGMTSYPVASLSEDQLMTMMDYYLSGVFDPLLYTEPKLVQREAWRYELADADADMNIAGTVYSEMQGALTLSALAQFNNLKTLYEGSATAHESGGIPADIRTLSYEELVAFHDTYYHPSNALITLYGDLDIAAFLEYIDGEYLSGFDKKDIAVDMGRVEPYSETKYAEYEVAVESGAPTDNASEIYYSFALNDADLEDVLSMSVVLSVILQESSPVMRALRKALPDAQIGGNLDYDSPSAPYITIAAQGVDPEDRDVLVDAVDQGLAELAASGISADALDSVVSAFKLSLLTTQEDKDLGVNASMNIALGWVYYDRIDFYPAYEQALAGLTLESANGLVERYITGNAHRAVSVTKPVAGLAEQNAAALAAELSEKKAAMSTEEIAALVQSSGDFMDWANTPASAELLDQLAGVSVAELPEERRHYDVADETVDGVRYLSAPADVPGVFSGVIMLDGSTIPVESLQDVQTVMRLLGELDTESYSKEELSTLITRYLPGLTTKLDSTLGVDGGGIYAGQLSFKGLAEDAETATELLSEILFKTDFSDTDAIKGLLNRWNADFANELDNNPLTIQLRRCMAMFNDYCAYRVYVDHYDMVAHSKELLALADSDPAALTARLEAARTLVLDRSAAVVLETGSEDAIAAYDAGIRALMAAMPNEERARVDYSVLRIPKRSEGVVVNSTVQMNVMASPYDGYSGKDAVTSMLIDDSYLLPQLRNALGAYGAYSNLDYVCSGLYTYRDPNLEGSYKIFEGLPEYLRALELTQEDVDSYIIGSYSGLSRPLGPLAGAMQVMTDMLVGRSEELRLQWMEEAKSTTVEDVVASAELWDALIADGVRSTSGTESTLTAASGLFDVLVYPDGTVKELSAAEPAS